MSSVGNQVSVVRIYNVLGIMVEEIETNSNEIEINTSEYNNGVYFIKIVTDKGEIIKQFIKE